MKITKKITSIMLVCMLALSSILFCGCNKDITSSSTASTNSSSSQKSSSASKGTKDNPFILGVSPMDGWYGWYGIDKTGIFKKNGVYVDIKFFSVYSDSLTAFYSGQVDGICIAASDAIAPLNEGVKFKIVLVNDNSYGADGLVVHNGINSIKDLKGKTVATEVGTLEHMFLLKMLEENGMTVNDINFVNMTINDAGPAFISGNVDAAVLWDPTLQTALSSGGKLLYSTKSEAGLIPDTLAVRQEVLDSSSDAVQKIVNSWFDGVKKMNDKDDEFINAVCDGAELEHNDYVSMLNDVTLFDKDKNLKTFKSGNDYTYLDYTMKKSADFLYSTKMITKVPDNISSIIDDTYVKGAK